MDARLALKQWRPFPELKNGEILQIMDELRIPISESDLIKPTPNVMQRVFELFLELFMGIPPTCPGSQPNFEVVDILEHPELHLEAINLMSFYKNM
jgi:kinetochore protein Nuf2